MDLESDNDRDLTIATSTASAPVATAAGSAISSAARFSSASAAEPMETTVRAASRVESATRQRQPSLSWNEVKPDLSICNSLGNLGTDATPGDDSDKDHNFGTKCVLVCWWIIMIFQGSYHILPISSNQSNSRSSMVYVIFI